MNAIETVVQRAHRNEKAAKTFITICGIGMALVPLLIGAFLFVKGTDTFFTFGHSVTEFLFSGQWKPSDTAEGGGQVGAAMFLAGSLVTCLLALVISLPFSLASSIYMTEIATPKRRRLIQPAIELFTGIPSVVYGFVGMTVLIPALRHIFPDALWLFRLSCRYRLGRHDFPDDYDDGSRCHGSCSQIVARSFLRPRCNALGNDCSRRPACC